MSVTSLIGLRYTKAKRDNHFVSFISLASVIGIALGVIVLIVVLSVINGYEDGMRDRYLGMLSHVTVSDSDWNLDDWETRRKQVLETKRVVAAAPFIEKQVMLKEGEKVKAIMLEAVMPDYEKDVGTINQFISDPAGLNKLKAGAFNIILGETLAKSLNVKAGESITLLSPPKKLLSVADNEQDQTPIIHDFNVVATFKMDMQIYDAGFAYIHLKDAQQLFDMENQATGLRVQIDDIYKAKEVTYAIADRLAADNEDYVLSNWTTQNANIFKAIKLQKTMLFLVLFLIIAVAAFNLVSTMIMVVTEKQSDIAILRTLGMSPMQIMKIFLVQGSVLGLIGTLIGTIVGLLIALNITAIVQWLEGLFNTHFLNASIHQITHIDARVEPLDIIIIALAAFLLTIIATLYPAWKASKVQPAEALRYE